MAPYQPTTLKVRSITLEQKDYLDPLQNASFEGKSFEEITDIIASTDMDILAELAHASFTMRRQPLR